ncbi:maleylpyruvate isomerase family mycothiol-dependent enzyme [Trujillonella endophytica]|uniref:TIGR03083 family protein n=1 Tax=Trujillonella endophytica TaxID=673521 RepID=A0A1H8PZ73_9ACTN|nr:maleylpyruvate isomerase family mycothiol-dependent enzyme [Trujillella endophytica]SEO47289.1 TIGR03083 family protein [Trujillella endophytica]
METTRPPALDHHERLAALAAEQGAVAALAAGAPADLPVPACGDWTVGVLVRHLAAVHRWAAQATRTDPAGELPDMRPAWRATTAGDYPAAAAELRDALADPARPCVTLTGPGTAGWWTRRQLHETLVHRLDLAAALGREAPVDPGIAADCVAEVLDTMQPRQVALGRMPPPVAGLRLTAPSGSWVLGPAPVAEVTGDEAALALLLWRRLGLDDGVGDGRLTVTGDRAAAAALLAEAVVP